MSRSAVNLRLLDKNLMDCSCIFCKFISGEIESERVVYEDDCILAFKETKHPLAPFHLLLIPKSHIKTGFDITSANSEYIAKIYEAAAMIACDKKLQGYKMICNNGLSAGQTVFHLHIHMISEG